MSQAAPLQLQAVTRSFRQGGRQIDVLQGVDLAIAAGEVAALVGPSGAGKSTLLHIAGLLERPSGGEILVAGHSCGNLDDAGRTALRRQEIGFVYQFHHLLPEFSALENIVMPQMIAGAGKAAARQRAEELLAAVGLSARADHRPGQLSGGEQQRVAIARALANRPALLLADEPTGNLDPETAEEVFALMIGQARAAGLGALIATHNLALADRMDRTLVLSEGRLATT